MTKARVDLHNSHTPQPKKRSLTSVDNEALLGLVSEPTSLLGASWPGRAVNRRELAVLPRADAEQKAHNIALLVAPQLLHILVGSHACCEGG